MATSTSHLVSVVGALLVLSVPVCARAATNYLGTQATGETSAPAFIDDFEDGSISDWSVTCGGWEFVPGFGTAGNEGLAIASAQDDNILSHRTFSGGFGHYHYEVYLPGDHRADGDLLFQIVGGNFYWILLGPNNSDNVVDRILRGSNDGLAPPVAIGCSPFHLTPLTWHTIDIYRFPNGVIRVHTDNEPAARMEAFDTSVSDSGGIAIRTFARGVRFDNVSFDPALEPDPQPALPPSCPPFGGGFLTQCSLGPPIPPSSDLPASPPVDRETDAPNPKLLRGSESPPRR